MADPVQHIVLFPRFTAFVSSDDLYSPPIDVRAFESAVFVAWQSRGLGASAGFLEFQLQHSANLETWENLGSTLSPAAGTEVAAERGFTRPWLRVKVGLGGDVQAVTGWLAGNFVPRDADGAGE